MRGACEEKARKAAHHAFVCQEEASKESTSEELEQLRKSQFTQIDVLLRFETKLNLQKSCDVFLANFEVILLYI